METTEQFLIRMGFDSAQVQAGLSKVVTTSAAAGESITAKLTTETGKQVAIHRAAAAQMAANYQAMAVTMLAANEKETAKRIANLQTQITAEKALNTEASAKITANLERRIAIEQKELLALQGKWVEFYAGQVKAAEAADARMVALGAAQQKQVLGWAAERRAVFEAEVATETKAAAERVAIWTNYLEARAAITARLTATETAVQIAAAETAAKAELAEMEEYKLGRDKQIAEITAMEDRHAKLNVLINKAEAAQDLEIYQAYAKARESITARLTAFEIEQTRLQSLARTSGMTFEHAGDGTGRGVGNWFGSAAGAAEAGGEGEGAGVGLGHSKTIMLREARVLIHELASGRWRNAFGSFMILLEATGGKMRAMINSLFGLTGAMIAGVGFAAYKLWQNIKGYNNELDEMAEAATKPFGNRAEAHKKAVEESIKNAAELRAHIASLATAHENLAEKIERVVRAMQKQAEVQATLIQASGNTQIAYVNMAQSLGMITPEQGGASRIKIQSDTFAAVQKTKLDALAAEGDTLRSASAANLAANPELQKKLWAAQANAFGTDDSGRVTNSAALARETAMKEYVQKGLDLKDDEARLKRMNVINDQNPTQALENVADPLFKSKEASIASLKSLIEKEKASIAADTAQNNLNIAAKAEALGALKEAQKALDENVTVQQNLNKQIADYGVRYGDSVTGIRVLYQDLKGRSFQNAAAMLDQASKEDRVSPTIEGLASGGGWMTRERNAYARAEWGGPFRDAARGVIHSKNQEMWDIAHGNAIFDKDGKLIGGAANDDRLRAVGFENQLRAAGLETPEMRQEKMEETQQGIFDEIQKLRQLAGEKGIKLDPDQ